VFIVLATANSAGYRYGASDQAFYVPAALLHIDPALFPRDGPLIESQARLTIADELIGSAARGTGAPLPAIFGVLYLATLTLLGCAAWLLARRIYRTTWAAAAWLSGLTLRHQIAQTGTNTLEGYFHPRQLAFALGVLALVTFLRRRTLATLAIVAAAAAVHPTTALWFGVWLGMATVADDRRFRIPAAIAAAIAGAALVWAAVDGPLAGRFTRMDTEWLATLETKDYLFPADWPLTVWVLNLSYVPIVVWLYVARKKAGLLAEREGALVAGCLGLFAVFCAALPFNAAAVQIAVQLQPARVFWMLDFLATLYVVWALSEWRSEGFARGKRLAWILLLCSAARGTYALVIEFPDRSLARIDVRDTDWGRVMRWARTTGTDSYWLADPLHAVLYGTSVRVAGHRDVFVEGVKDQAIGMYDRGVAMRTRDRLAAIGDFSTLTVDRARALAREYGLDYLVTDRTLDLPVAFGSGRLRVYALR
jgi:hypothetical protein